MELTLEPRARWGFELCVLWFLAEGGTGDLTSFPLRELIGTDPANKRQSCNTVYSNQSVVSRKTGGCFRQLAFWRGTHPSARCSFPLGPHFYSFHVFKPSLPPLSLKPLLKSRPPFSRSVLVTASASSSLIPMRSVFWTVPDPSPTA